MAIQASEGMSEGDSEMQTGSVKFFDNRDNKRFGFIVVNGGGEIFFHYNDGENIEAGTDTPQFCGGKLNDEPKKGDIIVFERSSGYKGHKAAPWGFATDYKKAEREIAARPAPTTYRVVEQYATPGSDKKGEPDVLWEGANVRNLCEKYPRPSDYRMDKLQSFSCGDFDKSVWFERMTENGWETCGDPRPVENEGIRRRW